MRIVGRCSASVIVPKKPTAKPCDAESLRKWKEKGVESAILDARLQFMEAEGIARYVRPLLKQERIFPHMLPTQASGRWSTTNPPLVNFPKHSPERCPRCLKRAEEGGPPESWCPRSVREIIVPDRDAWWLHFDLQAIEARINAALSGDTEDLEAFDQGYDIHTLTCCRGMGWELPPILTKQLHTAPECEAWRVEHSWGGENDRRRHVFKTIRYALQYALDERGALQSNELYKLGLKRQDILQFGRRYLASKPQMVARKQRAWDEALRTGVSYTVFGRRRRLYGKPEDRMKEAWSHKVSGTVSDMMNQILIRIAILFPECHLVLHSHDGLTVSFPLTNHPLSVYETLRPEVERTWDMEGTQMRSPATWEWVDAEGTSWPVSGL